MPKNSPHIDPVWEKQIALLGTGIDERARLLRGLCSDITPRESHVAVLAEKRFDNSEIGERLAISVATVDNHTSNVRHKVDAPRNVKIRNLIKFVEDRSNTA